MNAPATFTSQVANLVKLSSANENKKVVVKSRWSPKFLFQKSLRADSSGGGSETDDEECGGSPETIVQSGTDEDQEAAKDMASCSKHSSSLSSNKSVAGSQDISVMPQIKPLPLIR